MGEDFKRDLDDSGENEAAETIKSAAEELNSFGDKFAKAVADARTAIEKKEAVESADGTKKKSRPSPESEKDDTMESDDLMEKINSGMDKLIALNGPDMTLAEAKEFINDNEELVEAAI